MTDRRSPLDAVHRALGAKMVPFGGWEMPLSYPAGTIAEHLACRRGAVVFDVSHLGTVRVEGPGAFDALQAAFTNDLRKVEPGRAQYTHLLDEADASVLDDIIVWWLAPEQFDVMPNASNTSRVTDALVGRGAGGGRPGGEGDQAAGDVQVADVTATRAVLAVQGPAARERLATVCPEAADVGRFRVAPLTWRGAGGQVAGTGYTGEDGVEITLPPEPAAELWSALLDAGVEPAGLGARDTLRLEAGLPLHGHELGPGISPLQAGLGWVVGWDKPAFRGRDALVAERDAGPTRRLRGFVVEGRRPPRAGQTVLVDGKPAGEVTSGNFSPVLERGIALAFLPPEVVPGTAVQVDVRGSHLDGEIVELPFTRLAG